MVAEHVLFGRPLVATAAVISHHSPLTSWMYEGWNKPEWCDSIGRVLKEILEESPDFDVDVKNLLKKALSFGKSPSDILHSYQNKLLSHFKCIPWRDYAQVKTVLHLADWLASAGKNDVDELFLKDGDGKISSFIKSRNFKLRNFQQKSYSLREKNNIRLKAPTGSGKTEALLLWSGEARRILYLLPTQATVNAMWRRLISIYGEENVGISHGRSNYIIRKQKEHTEDELPLDYKLFSSVFAKPVVVATLDQFLMGYLNGRHWEERLTLSGDSAVIIDEIHTYEPFTLGILKAALEWQMPHKLAMASATLPGVLLDIFKGDDLIEADEYFWERKRHNLQVLESHIDSQLAQAIDIAKKGGRVLIIVNSVKKAQEVYSRIEEKWQNTILLHSRFIYRDRMKKEHEAQKAQKGIILVSTQVVEVSLDISYDILFSEVAPMDALIQRMGRVNRYGKKPPANVLIFTELGTSSSRVYDKEVIETTLDILKDLPEIPAEKQLSYATDKLYKEIASKDRFWKEIQEGEDNLREIKKYLGNYTIDLSDEEIRGRFITRKGMLSIDVIPEQFLNEAYKFVEEDKRWKIVELTVPVPIYWIKVYTGYFYPDSGLHYTITKLKYNEDRGLIHPEEHEEMDETPIW